MHLAGDAACSGSASSRHSLADTVEGIVTQYIAGMQLTDEVLQSSLDAWEATLSAPGVDLAAVRASLAV